MRLALSVGILGACMRVCRHRGCAKVRLTAGKCLATLTIHFSLARCLQTVAAINAVDIFCLMLSVFFSHLGVGGLYIKSHVMDRLFFCNQWRGKGSKPPE